MFKDGCKTYCRLHGVLAGMLLSLSCCNPAFAGGLLDTLHKNAGRHDFMSYFGFAENKAVNCAAGLTDHVYYSKTWTCSLVLSVDKNGRIVHMKLGVPRPLLDDEKVCTRGRDIVKSFVLASALGQDIPRLKTLADEIYVRGLDLQPIKLDAQALASAHKTVPQLHAYKIGKGQLANGDDAIFLPELPRLSPRASELFETVAGKRANMGQIYRNCRIAFMNEQMQGATNPMKLLWCDTWDEAYWKAHFASVQNNSRK